MAQNANNTYRIPSPDDAHLLILLEKMAEVVGGSFSLYVGGHNIGAFDSGEKATAWFGRSLVGSRIINTANISHENFTVAFRRSITQFGSHNTLEASNWEAEFFAYRGSQAPADYVSKLVRVAVIIDAYKREFFGKIKPAQAPKDFSDLYARQLADLTDLHNKIVSDAEAARLRGEETLRQKQAEHDAEVANARSKLSLEADHLRSKIRLEEEALAKRKKDIDDRSHTHARRQMREAITGELKARQQRPAVSRNTAFLRLGILSACGVAFVLLGGLALVTSQEIFALVNGPNPLTTAFYAVVVRGGLLTLGAVGVAGYLINFLRRIHDEDLRSERDLERYLYDVDRASWAIETVLEAQRRDGENDPVEIPQEWVEGVTRGLFQRSDSRDPEEASLAALASVFNFAAEAELGPGGTKIRFNKPGLRALKRHTEQSSE